MPTILTLPENMPRVVVVGGLKGGIGKSTLSMFIALVYAVVYGKRVLLVDADPSSQTGWDWWTLANAKGEALPIDVETWPHAKVGEVVLARTPGKYDVVVIDCGGDSDAILSSAVSVCHYAFIATTANKPDIRRVAPTFQAAAKAAQEVGRGNDITASVICLRVYNSRSTKKEELASKIAERLPILEQHVSERPAMYSDVFGDGVPPMRNLEETHKAMKEMGAVDGFTEVAA
jgi:chromosome partitioning protein